VTHVKLPSLAGGGADLIRAVVFGVDIALVIASSFLSAPPMRAAVRVRRSLLGKRAAGVELVWSRILPRRLLLARLEAATFRIFLGSSDGMWNSAALAMANPAVAVSLSFAMGGLLFGFAASSLRAVPDAPAAFKAVLSAPAFSVACGMVTPPAGHLTGGSGSALLNATFLEAMGGTARRRRPGLVDEVLARFNDRL